MLQPQLQPQHNTAAPSAKPAAALPASLPALVPPEVAAGLQLLGWAVEGAALQQALQRAGQVGSAETSR